MKTPEEIYDELCEDIDKLDRRVIVIKAIETYHTQFTTVTPSHIRQIEGLKVENGTYILESDSDIRNGTINEAIEILRQSPPVIQVKDDIIDFAQWYSGMERGVVVNAYKRYLIERETT